MVYNFHLFRGAEFCVFMPAKSWARLIVWIIAIHGGDEICYINLLSFIIPCANFSLKANKFFNQKIVYIDLLPAKAIQIINGALKITNHVSHLYHAGDYNGRSNSECNYGY